MNGTPVLLGEAAEFLAGRYAGQARDICELGGGDWSRAFSFRLAGRDLVARFGLYGEDFGKDQQAMTFAGPDLPVPEVLETGRALDGAYAISQRCYGVFLETLDEAGWRRLLPALLRGLDTLRQLPAPAAGGTVPRAGGTVPGPAGGGSWREWLWSGLDDRPGARVSGWTAILAGQPVLSELFGTAQRAFSDLVGACPEIRHVLHGDLLNRNVLVAPDASRLTAVFDWACSACGDFLYEAAWFTFWAPWHAGLAAIDFRSVIRAHYDATGVEVPGFAERLRCYELHIGLTHLAYCAFAGRHDDLRAVAQRTREILGPSLR
jgi:aminoglycoside phosphotransferase (APT) family kinase protein